MNFTPTKPPLKKQKKLSKSVRHIELAKTLIGKALYNEAYDHYKKTIEDDQKFAYDILTFLYKKNINNDSELYILIAKIYFLINMPHEGFDCLEEALELTPKNETIYDEFAKLISKKNLVNKIKVKFEQAFKEKVFYPSKGILCT